MRNKHSRTFNHEYLTRKAGELGLTQAAIGRKLGVSSSPVSNWFTGRFNPKEKHIKALVALGFRESALVKTHGVQQVEETPANPLILPPPSSSIKTRG